MFCIEIFEYDNFVSDFGGQEELIYSTFFANDRSGRRHYRLNYFSLCGDFLSDEVNLAADTVGSYLYQPFAITSLQR